MTFPENFSPCYPSKFSINNNGICNKNDAKEISINENFMAAYEYMLNSDTFKEISTCELSSYRIKGIIEQDMGIGHISNGQMIVVLCSLGFLCKEDGRSLNPIFNVREKIARKLRF